MKNTIRIIIGCSLLMVLACNNNKAKQESKETSNIVTQKDSSNNISKELKKDFLEIGNELMNYERIGDIKLGLTTLQTVQLLGEPDKKSESELWEADGEYHQKYIYSSKGIELGFIGDTDNDKVIDRIKINEPCAFKTCKDIVIGSNINDINSAYNDYIDPDFSSSESIVAGSIYGGIIFSLKDKKVESIFIGASAE